MTTAHYLNPLATLRHLWKSRELSAQFMHREVVGRYQGSQLGLSWAVIQPLLTLLVYTVVFGVILKARWSEAAPSHAQFALTLFCGMIVFGVFSEGAVRAPSLIVDNPNYVKKVVFPLEVLPVAVLGGTLFNALLGLAILVAGLVLTGSGPSWHALYLPVVLVPLVMLTLGVSWFLASLGVFVRDVRQIAAILFSQLLFFLTPVIYPLSAVPERLRWLIAANPLAVIVEEARGSLIWGRSPDWPAILRVTVLSAVVMQLGYAWFMRSKRGFADVL